MCQRGIYASMCFRIKTFLPEYTHRLDLKIQRKTTSLNLRFQKANWWFLKCFVNWIERLRLELLSAATLKLMLFAGTETSCSFCLMPQEEKSRKFLYRDVNCSVQPTAEGSNNVNTAVVFRSERAQVQLQWGKNAVVMLLVLM